MQNNSNVFSTNLLGKGWKHLQFKWKGNRLGLLWVVLHPALEILLYYLIFSNLFAIDKMSYQYGEHYLIYLCIGVIPWTLFSDGLFEGSVAYISNGYYLKKIPAPLWHYTLHQSVAGMISLAIGLLVTMFLVLISGIAPSVTWVSLILVLLSMGLMMAGLNFWTSIITVYFKDFKDTLNVLLKFIFWSMPLIYFKEAVPDVFQAIIDWHPLYFYIEHMRVVLIEGSWYSPFKMLLGLVIAVAFFASGLWLQKKSEGQLRDIL